MVAVGRVGRGRGVGDARAAAWATTAMAASPHVLNPWPPELGRTAADRERREYLDRFAGLLPWEFRQGADWLRAHTRPDDAVQTYGMDPYLLFLAERRSATPYIYVYDLNLDAARDGASEWAPDDEAPRVLAHIDAVAKEHERDLLERMKRSPPAALVFFDHAPLTTWPDAIHDFEVHESGRLGVGDRALCAARHVRRHPRVDADRRAGGGGSP